MVQDDEIILRYTLTLALSPPVEGEGDNCNASTAHFVCAPGFVKTTPGKQDERVVLAN
jgi:hypothetical protein